MPTSSRRKKIMKSLTRSSMAVQVERMEMGERKVVNRTSRMLRPSTPMAKLMFQPATWIQGRVKPSCRSGLDLSNRVSIQMDRPKVASEATSAVQRRAFFLSDGMKSKASTPTRGKKVTKMRGLEIKFMFTPQSRQTSKVKDKTLGVRLSILFQQEIA